MYFGKKNHTKEFKYYCTWEVFKLYKIREGVLCFKNRTVLPDDNRYMQKTTLQRRGAKLLANEDIIFLVCQRGEGLQCDEEEGFLPLQSVMVWCSQHNNEMWRARREDGNRHRNTQQGTKSTMGGEMRREMEEEEEEEKQQLRVNIWAKTGTWGGNKNVLFYSIY